MVIWTTQKNDVNETSRQLMVCGSSSHALLYLGVQYLLYLAVKQKQLLLERTTYMLEYGLHCFSDLCIIKKKYINY